MVGHMFECETSNCFEINYQCYRYRFLRGPSLFLGLGENLGGGVNKSWTLWWGSGGEKKLNNIWCGEGGGCGVIKINLSVVANAADDASQINKVVILAQLYNQHFDNIYKFKYIFWYYK